MNGISCATGVALALLWCQQVNASVETECEQRAAVHAALDLSALSYQAFLLRAKAGERHAQLVVGLSHTSIRTYLREKADQTEGKKWLEAAAKQGSLFAMNQLAGDWWRVGAEAGDPMMQALYGHRLSRGDGVEKDQVAAVRWWTLAANKGSHISQAKLSVAYDKGIGVKPDKKAALYWSLLAARPLGSVVMTFGGQKIPQALKAQLSDDEITEVRRQVSDWLQRYRESERLKADKNEKECGQREIMSNKGFW